MLMHGKLSFFCLVKGLRAQIDRDIYRSHMQEEIRGVAGLDICEDTVEDLVVTGDTEEQQKVAGVCLGK